MNHVDDDELGQLYRGATGVVQFSRYEGFDYPVAGAMTLGVPLVLSDIGVHREVAGSCALYVDTDDTDGLASCLVEMACWNPDRQLSHAKEAARQVEKIRTPAQSLLSVYQSLLPHCSGQVA